eukprot:15336301-Ditylum_brightwellii.AAC.1
MEYHMVTGYGMSKLTAKNTEDNPIYGLGQRATDVLPNWTLMANIYQKAYDKFSKRCMIIDPTRAISLKSNRKMCVDDEKLVHNEKAMNTQAKTLMSF